MYEIYMLHVQNKLHKRYSQLFLQQSPFKQDITYNMVTSAGYSWDHELTKDTP